MLLYGIFYRTSLDMYNICTIVVPVLSLIIYYLYSFYIILIKSLPTLAEDSRRLCGSISGRFNASITGAGEVAMAELTIACMNNIEAVNGDIHASDRDVITARRR